ncbi:hypothetical protein L2E82_24413 [Cichorium intybus]|uniref:Uncharacterized protein n=1 Tax=Cichorium intybus TaxID=13427 RepID=A0ACB9E098_CICIN|nr:hypothetical protein L2E82_24413 [Cichorium intybus]
MEARVHEAGRQHSSLHLSPIREGGATMPPGPAFPAVLPDLAVGVGEGTNITHVDHGGRKIRMETSGVFAVLLHQGISGATAVQLLV